MPPFHQTVIKKYPGDLFAVMDTAPDCSGTCKPIHHRYYDGSDIVLPDDTSQVLSMRDSPTWKTYQPWIITASGLPCWERMIKAVLPSLWKLPVFYAKSFGKTWRHKNFIYTG